MKIRRVFFWAHLSAGLLSGLLVLLMSATGILLAYEQQLVAHADTLNRVAPPEGATPLTADRWVAAARERDPAAAHGTLIVSADPDAPVRVSLGRDRSLLLDPYSAALLDDHAAGTRDALHTIERWHRWLGGDPGSVRAGLMGAANLVFLFLVCSGIYLWLPARWSRAMLRVRLLFNGQPPSSKVRDYNWHHVFSSWALVPLAIIVSSGVVMSYPWANRLLFAAFGEAPPARGGPPGQAAERDGPPAGEAWPASLDALLASAKAHVPNWQTLHVPLGVDPGFVTIAADVAGDPIVRRTLRISTTDTSRVTEGDSLPAGRPRGGTPGQRLRGWLRFAHTGQEYGPIGQTIAALASLAACFLVYTGFALAYRRLIHPFFSHAAG
jgi:uncharacterized iron-regulated membrane protein